MKKVLSYFVSLVLVLGLLMYPNHEAYAANVSLGVSASTVNIGDTVTVSVTVPDNVTATIDLTFSTNVVSFVNASTDVGTNGGTITINAGKMSMANSNTVSVKFKANTSGTASFNASVISAVDNNTVEDVTLSGASATVTVANQTTNSGNGGGAAEEQKSGDNSLASLKLSSGTLSPSFKYNVTKYTATVGYDVTKVYVDAKPSNGKATIESVTGDGTVDLKVGENTIQVVVKAENGLKATYTIVVTRKSESDEPDVSESASETTTPEVSEVLQWNGEQLQMTTEIPEESIPTGFETTSVVVKGQQMPGLSFSRGDLKVLYLNNTNGAGSLYVYDEVQQTIYPFIKIESERSYVMILLPNEETEPVPEGFENCTLSIEGKGLVNAYQLKEDAPVEKESLEDSTMSWNLFGAENFYAAEAKASEFYLIYCMNDAGEKGWYMYDAVEGTFQRYLALVHSVQANGELSDSSNEEYAQLEKELKTAKMTQYIIIGIAIAVVIILIIVIVVLVLKKRSGEEDFFDEYEDEDEYEEEDVDDYVDEVIEGISQSIAEESEDGVYVNTMIDKKDDDDDLEFIDFE